jgi:ribosome-associated heat shock protein Hsp15
VIPCGTGTPVARQRLDKWLWFARFARTRGAAQELVEAGAIRVDSRRVTSPGHGLKCGDVLTVAAPHGVFVVRVTDLGERRKGASEARLLYERLDTRDQTPA